jgi:hypothetical protein
VTHVTVGNVTDGYVVTALYALGKRSDAVYLDVVGMASDC